MKYVDGPPKFILDSLRISKKEIERRKKDFRKWCKKSAIFDFNEKSGHLEVRKRKEE